MYQEVYSSDESSIEFFSKHPCVELACNESPIREISTKKSPRQEGVGELGESLEEDIAPTINDFPQYQRIKPYYPHEEIVLYPSGSDFEDSDFEDFDTPEVRLHGIPMSAVDWKRDEKVRLALEKFEKGEEVHIKTIGWKSLGLRCREIERDRELYMESRKFEYEQYDDFDPKRLKKMQTENGLAENEKKNSEFVGEEKGKTEDKGIESEVVITKSINLTTRKSAAYVISTQSKPEYAEQDKIRNQLRNVSYYCKQRMIHKFDQLESLSKQDANIPSPKLQQ